MDRDAVPVGNEIPQVLEVHTNTRSKNILSPYHALALCGAGTRGGKCAAVVVHILLYGVTTQIAVGLCHALLY